MSFIWDGGYNYGGSVVVIPWYPGVVPGAHAGLCVQEVDLALHRGPLLCRDKGRNGEKSATWPPLQLLHQSQHWQLIILTTSTHFCHLAILLIFFFWTIHFFSEMRKSLGRCLKSLEYEVTSGKDFPYGTVKTIFLSDLCSVWNVSEYEWVFNECSSNVWEALFASDPWRVSVGLWVSVVKPVYLLQCGQPSSCWLR